MKDKERFSAYAISYAENNRILEDFKSIYWALVTEHPELTAKQVADYYRSNFTTHEAQFCVYEGWSLDLHTTAKGGI